MKTVHLSRIDLNLFVVFDAIYSEGGITRASKRLSLTQPAISHALGRLREMFDDPLFLRQGKAMIPTPLARVIIDPVRQSLQGFESTLQRVDRFDPATARRHFTVGMRDLRELTVLPNLLRAVTRAAPFIDISVVRAERRQLEARARGGHARRGDRRSPGAIRSSATAACQRGAPGGCGAAASSGGQA